MENNWRLGVRTPLPIQNHLVPSQSKTVTDSSSASFQNELDKKIQSVQLSAHAKDRLEKRGIQLTASDFTKIGQAITTVASKGGRESLLLYKDSALVVNVRNRTIITAMDPSAMKEHVFTHIDSAMIL